MTIKPMLCLSILLAAAVHPSHGLDLAKVPASDWIQIFNKKNLDGWVKKIVGLKVGEDPDSTWYVMDSILWVDYSKYKGNFDGRLGQMGYEKRKFSYYLMRTQVAFWGTQYQDGPDYGKENNGLLYHSQSMGSMDLYQGFPDAVELQLLGENTILNQTGTTANVCGIGATFIIDGVRGDYWCRTAKPRNVIGQPWVKVEALIQGDSISRHIVEGDTVLTYTSIVAKKDGKPLKEGYIVIQAESAPTKFKSIEVLNLAGCMDPKFGSYRSYFLKSDPSACSSTVSMGVQSNRFAEPQVDFAADGFTVDLAATGSFTMTLTDVRGNSFGKFIQNGPGRKIVPLKRLSNGVYYLGITGKTGIWWRTISVMNP